MEANPKAQQTSKHRLKNISERFWQDFRKATKLPVSWLNHEFIIRGKQKTIRERTDSLPSLVPSNPFQQHPQLDTVKGGIQSDRLGTELGMVLGYLSSPLKIKMKKCLQNLSFKVFLPSWHFFNSEKKVYWHKESCKLCSHNLQSGLRGSSAFPLLSVLMSPSHIRNVVQMKNWHIPQNEI